MFILLTINVIILYNNGYTLHKEYFLIEILLAEYFEGEPIK